MASVRVPVENMNDSDTKITGSNVDMTDYTAFERVRMEIILRIVVSMLSWVNYYKKNTCVSLTIDAVNMFYTEFEKSMIHSGVASNLKSHQSRSSSSGLDNPVSLFDLMVSLMVMENISKKVVGACMAPRDITLSDWFHIKKLVYNSIRSVDDSISHEKFIHHTISDTIDIDVGIAMIDSLMTKS